MIKASPSVLTCNGSWPRRPVTASGMSARLRCCRCMGMGWAIAKRCRADRAGAARICDEASSHCWCQRELCRVVDSQEQVPQKRRQRAARLAGHHPSAGNVGTTGQIPCSAANQRLSQRPGVGQDLVGASRRHDPGVQQAAPVRMPASCGLFAFVHQQCDVLLFGAGSDDEGDERSSVHETCGGRGVTAHLALCSVGEGATTTAKGVEVRRVVSPRKTAAAAADRRRCHRLGADGSLRPHPSACSGSRAASVTPVAMARTPSRPAPICVHPAASARRAVTAFDTADDGGPASGALPALPYLGSCPLPRDASSSLQSGGERQSVNRGTLIVAALSRGCVLSLLYHRCRRPPAPPIRSNGASRAASTTRWWVDVNDVCAGM